jgi:uncharacterized SAM-binding protein YcdF (DUF218 family)
VFVLIGKIVGPMVSPLGLCLALWIAAAVLAWRGGAWGKRFAWAGILILLGFSSPLGGEALLGALEDDYPVLDVAACPQSDAIVILAGMTDPPLPPRKEIDVGSAFDRLLHGLRLLRAGRAPLLVLSGGVIPALSGTEESEAAQMRQLLLEYGVAPEDMLLEERSRNTYENAVFTRQLLETRGLHQVLLVTSASHMRRAMGAFRGQGIAAVAAPTDVRVVSRPFPSLQLLPTLWGLECSTWAAKEYVGWWIYRLRGWVR